MYYDGQVFYESDVICKVIRNQVDFTDNINVELFFKNEMHQLLEQSDDQYTFKKYHLIFMTCP